jgi:hypothetical protein
MSFGWQDQQQTVRTRSRVVAPALEVPYDARPFSQRPERFMNLKLMVAVSLLAATPAFAQMQKQPGPPPNVPKPTKEAAQKVVAAISADKGKLQVYCDLAKLNDQMAQADQKKDTKTLESLGAKADELSEKLGPDYVNLMDGLEQLDENSPVGKDIAAAFDPLDKQCK